MKTSMYFNYTSRALLRGGLRTILAVFCVTVGVMAIVSLQLVGFMLKNSLSTSAREANGGDIAVSAQGAPFKTSDLTFFTSLKGAGTITNYTAISSANATLNNAASANQFFNLQAVDPNNFPLISQPTFATPTSGSLSHLLTHNQVIVTQRFLTTYHKHSGDTFNVYVKSALGTGRTITVNIVGVIENTGMFAQAGNLLLISSHDYLASAPAGLANYTLVDIATVDQAHTNQAVKAINQQFSFVNTQTATDILKAQQSSIDLISNFLEIAGLIALLIGGIGIINTMQMLLSRRKTEIAMLKTTGYRRRDLYLLFGLETGLLGLIGGIIGATAAIGVSYLIRTLMQNLGSNVPFVLNPGFIIGGIAVGLVTALIFGLLPIVQAASIRPLNVLRQLDNHSVGGRVSTIFLLILFSILFCFLAIVILNNNVLLGIFITYGTFAFLLILSGLFGLIILGISKLPVPNGIYIPHILLVLLSIVVSVLVYQTLPVFGIFLLAFSFLGIAIVLLPRSWKVNVKMALRNLGRQRVRTTTTLLALFIGVYGIGMDLGIGQDLRTTMANALNHNSPYNLVATTVDKDTNTLQAHLQTIKGLTDSRKDTFTAALPVAINGQPSQQALPKGKDGQDDLRLLGGIEGYDLAHTLPAQKVIEGRNLNASDAHTNNILVSAVMTKKGWAQMSLKTGDTVTFASLDGKSQKTATIVGIISIATSFETLGEVMAPDSLAHDLNTATNSATTVFYMKVAPTQIDQAISMLNQIVPDASVHNLSDAAVSFLQQVGSVLDIIIAIASLSMIAAVIIIANSVALAMLERRRELGILKSVGYTSRTILTQVMIENGIIGGIGAFVATLLAAGGVTIGSKVFFSNNLTLNMEPVIAINMIILPALLAILTAVLVAWQAVRIRPLEVLRYE